LVCTACATADRIPQQLRQSDPPGFAAVLTFVHDASVVALRVGCEGIEDSRARTALREPAT
jgi:hypothetical protein